MRLKQATSLILKAVFNKSEVYFPNKLKVFQKAQKPYKYFLFKKDSSHFFLTNTPVCYCTFRGISKSIFKSKVTARPSL